MSLDLASKVASDIVIYSKYAKYTPELKRRETWSEIVNRYKQMMLKKYPNVGEDIERAVKFIERKEVLPSMRMLQFAGAAIEKNNARGYNCGFTNVTSIKFFKGLMFLLLGGTGVGYSVQHRHISLLPTLTRPTRQRRWVVGDSIEGWADSINGLFRAFFGGKSLPRFDYSDIREKGTRLVTAGGKAPGPGPLRVCHDKILGLLESKAEGSRLTSVEVCDLACFIADAVLAGGIRRAAMICLFDKDDSHMAAYKAGAWWELNPQRGRVNISAICLRSDLSKEEFDRLFSATEASGSGEPGIYLTSDPDHGTNPCAEIGLRSQQFCNLSTVNLSGVSTNGEFLNRVRAATILGTLQAGFVDFHYLEHIWEDNTKEEALLGISITGIGDVCDYENFDFEGAAQAAVTRNKELAEKIGINPAARVTCIKPEGTASLVLGTASGVHGRHAPFYVRRFRFKRNESIIIYLANKIPALVVEDKSDPDCLILELPQKSPERSILRTESAEDLLERAKFFHSRWVNPGHQSGVNKHNVSVTVSVKPHEWEGVREWMWTNREHYNGISLLPYDGGTYVQAPFEGCSEETYNEMLKHLTEVDLSEVIEDEDNTERVQEAACAGGQCQI